MDFILNPNLVLYLPLWKLDGSSFMSKDACGHLCTVTGALWRPQGRYFDGADDKITIPHTTSIDDVFDGGGTLLAWINPDSDGENNAGRIANRGAGGTYWAFFTSSEATGKVKLTFHFSFAGGAPDQNGYWDTTSTEVTIGTPAMVGVTYNTGAVTNDPIIYVNGESVAITESSTPTGTRDSDAASDLVIGNTATEVATFDGKIGEFLFYNRALTPQEIQNIYLATRWRYR